jgi:hypothetical protein
LQAEEEALSLRQRYLTILTQMAPAGAVGLSALLGLAAPGAATEPPTGVEPSATAKEGVSERLAAIRDAVSAIDRDTSDAAKAAGRLAWGNWGWGWHGGGWPNWNNWHNWRNWGNFFRNW